MYGGEKVEEEESTRFSDDCLPLVDEDSGFSNERRGRTRDKEKETNAME
jgi:hypothetical protein